MFAEAGNRAVRSSFVKFDANPKQTNDSTSCNKPRGVKAARRNLRFESDIASSNGTEKRPAAGVNVCGISRIEVRVLSKPSLTIRVPERQRGIMVNQRLTCSMTTHDVVDHPAHHAADEDGQRSGDGEVRADSEGKRTDAEKFNDDDEGDTKQHQGPGQFAREDAIDDGGHQAALRSSGLFAADALNPLDFDLASGGVVEILAVLERSRADGVEQDVLVGVRELCFGLIVSPVW